jgi:hypothetical protein
MASSLYCGDCCVNKLLDTDINQCDCCQCIRVPNKEMFKREAEEDEWDAIYGFEQTKTRTFIMSGGSVNWWHYVVEFDSNCEQTAVYIESKSGRFLQYKKRLAYRINEDNVEQLRLVDIDWTPNHEANENFIVCMCDC